MDLKVFEKLKEFVLNNNINIENTRFALDKNNNWIIFINEENQVPNHFTIKFCTLENNSLKQIGFANYGVGKGFWTDRQISLDKVEVESDYRGSGLSTYGLSFLTEIANNKRINLIDGKYFPTSLSAKTMYNQNGFSIEKEYYDTRIVKYVQEQNIELIKANTKTVDGVRIYNNYKQLQINKDIQQDTQDQLET